MVYYLYAGDKPPPVYIMALAGQQVVNLVATVDGLNPTSQSPFPPCGTINAANRFPQSPTPAFTLLTAQVQSISANTDTINYPGAGAQINVDYWTGSVKQTSTIFVTQSVTTVNSLL